VGPSLVEGDTLSGRVPGAGERDRVQTAVVDVLLDATEVEAAGQHIGEGTVVEQRNRAGARHQRDRGEPAQPHAGDPDRVGTVNVLDAKALPNLQEPPDRGVE